MTYALGRRVEYYDMPAIRAIIRDAAKNDNRCRRSFWASSTARAFRMASRDDDRLTTDAGEAKRSTLESR